MFVLPLLGTFTWPKAIAMGLGDESGEDVNDDTCDRVWGTKLIIQLPYHILVLGLLPGEFEFPAW